MNRALVEHRLTQVHKRLKRAKEELALVDEQLVAFSDAEDEARIRSLVSETPIAGREHEEARRHAEAMIRSRADVQATIAALERMQDELLDRLASDKGTGRS